MDNRVRPRARKLAALAVAGLTLAVVGPGVAAGAASLPGAPALTGVRGGVGSITVSFGPPSSNGGSPITGYRATCVSPNGGPDAASPFQSSSPIVVSGLPNGKTYRCSVAARNAVGIGPRSSPSRWVTLPKRPGPPGLRSSHARVRTIVVGFSPPLSTGGTPITGYRATCVSPNGGVTRSSVYSLNSPLTVAPVSSGKNYRCSVVAVNAVGAGPASGRTGTLTVPDVPGMPAISAATPSPGRITVAFAAPTFTGGVPISGYRATCVSGNGGVTGSSVVVLASPVVVYGLTRAKTYQCSVVATNAVGTGHASTPSTAVTVPTVPGAPTITGVTAGIGGLRVAFSPPASNGGWPVSGYRASCSSTDGGLAGTSALSLLSPLPVSGLTDASTYQCTVRAKNAVGAGPISSASASVVVLAPPVVSLDPVASPANLTTPTLGGDCTTVDGDVTVVVSGPTPESLSAPCTAGAYSMPATELADGEYTAQASQTADSAVGSSSVLSLVIDTAAPAMSVALSTASDDAAAVFGGDCSSGDGDVAVIVTGPTPEVLSAVCDGDAYSVPVSPSLTDGVYGVLVSQTDAAGNTGSTEIMPFVIDTTAPGVDLAGVPSPSNETGPLLSGDCSEGDGPVSVVVSGPTSEEFSVPCAAGIYAVTASPGLSDGAYTVQALQTDEAGNTGSSATQPFVVDTTPPTVALATLPSPSNVVTPALAGTCSALDGAVLVAVSGPTAQELTVPCVLGAYSVTPGSSLADGSYSAIASQTDAAGNTGSSITRSFVIDATPPVVSISVASPTNNATPLLAGNCSTGDGTVTVTVAGPTAEVRTASCTAGSYSVAASPTLLDGAFTAVASQTDAAGNTGSSATVPFVVDTVAPVTTDNASAAWVNHTVTVTLSPSDTGGSGVAATYYTTNGSTPTTASARGASIVVSVPGAYTIKYFSVDNAGNTETVKTATNQVRIDETAPTTTDNVSAAWVNHTVTATLSPSDTGGSGIAATYYTTDGSTPTTASEQGTSIVVSVPGVYTIKYFSVDNAGNTEAVKTATNQVRIDETAPVTTDNTLSIGSTCLAVHPTVTLSPTDAGGSGIAATYFTTNGSTPTVASSQGTSIPLTVTGLYTIKYFSVDNAGNTEAVKTAGGLICVL